MSSSIPLYEGKLIKFSKGLLEEVDLTVIVDENPYPDVKLPVVNKERSLNILLYDKTIMLDLKLGRCTSHFSSGLDPFRYVCLLFQ